MCGMKRQLNGREMRKWTDAVGGIAEAARLIRAELECSLSKAEKLAACRYDREISASEQKVLARLTGSERDVLFHFAGRRITKAS